MRILKAIAFASILCLGAFSQDEVVSLDEMEKVFSDVRKNVGGDAELLEAMTFETGSAEIPQDLPRALSVHAHLYQQNKNPIAAYKLGMLAWNYEKAPQSISPELIKILNNAGGTQAKDYFLAGTQNKEIRYQEIAKLNSIVLGIYLFLHDDMKGSIQALNMSDSVANNSLSQLYLAFNYLKLKDTKMANFYLNRACFHENPEPSVVNFCKNSDSLKRTATLGQ